MVPGVKTAERHILQIVEVLIARNSIAILD